MQLNRSRTQPHLAAAKTQRLKTAKKENGILNFFENFSTAFDFGGVFTMSEAAFADKA